MPNIVVVGDGERLNRASIAKIVTKLGVKAEDGVITSSPVGLHCFDMTGKGAPYLIVRDTDKGRGMRIATALNKELHVDVEVDGLVAFLPKK